MIGSCFVRESLTEPLPIMKERQDLAADEG
jgi:hypothetical protein